MDKTEAGRILAALKSGEPLIDRRKAAQALEWAMDRVLVDQCPTSATGNHLYSHEKQGCFYCGAATGIAGPEQVLGPRWISVEDRLPDGDRSVLVYMAGLIHTGYVNSQSEWHEAVDCYPLRDVTHWQPLPAGPGVRDE